MFAFVVAVAASFLANLVRYFGKALVFADRYPMDPAACHLNFAKVVVALGIGFEWFVSLAESCCQVTVEGNAAVAAPEIGWSGIAA